MGGEPSVCTLRTLDILWKRIFSIEMRFYQVLTELYFIHGQGKIFPKKLFRSFLTTLSSNFPKSRWGLSLVSVFNFTILNKKEINYHRIAEPKAKIYTNTRINCCLILAPPDKS